MLAQEILNEGERDFTNPDTGTSEPQLVRETSDLGEDKYVDWYMDLMVDSVAKGERVVSAPIARGFLRPHIIFVSIIPGEDPCVAGGVSWLMELDARDGSKTDYSVFDLNYDGKIDTADNDGPTVLNGWRKPGIQTAPSIIAAGETERKFLSSSTGDIRTVTEVSPAASAGRQSWQQLK
jgi:type IV pilus assembly protein PilY1